MVIVESVGGACCDSEVELLLRDAMVDWNGVGVVGLKVFEINYLRL